MRDILRILIAPLVWLASFSAVYGLHGLLCALGAADGTSALLSPRFALLAAYGLVLLLQGVILLGLYSSRFAAATGFVRFVSHATGWVGLVAAAWSLMPVVTTSVCR